MNADAKPSDPTVTFETEQPIPTGEATEPAATEGTAEAVPETPV